MKFLVVIALLISSMAYAGEEYSMVGAGVGFGTGLTPTYGADYEHVYNLGGYTDFAVYGNKTTVQPYFSFGVQGDHMNLGLAAAVTMIDHGSSQYEGQFAFGPEFGIMQNITKLLYVKENNSYLDYHGTFNFSCTLGLGLNL